MSESSRPSSPTPDGMGSRPTGVDVHQTVGGLGPSEAAAGLVDAARASEEAILAHQLRRASVLLAVLWVTSFALDAVAALAAHVTYWWLLVARCLPLPAAVVGALIAFRSERVSLKTTQRVLIATDVTTTLWLSWLSLEVGGLDSQYQTAVMFVALSLAIVPLPVRQSLVRHGISTVTYAGAMLFGHYGLHLGAAETTPDDPWLFGVHFMMCHAMSASMVLISHSLYTLRREVFSAKNVGRYQLRRLLGRGGMGEVWAAYHANLKREVALKLVRVGDDQPQLAQRFEREVEAMTKLSHPNSVRIYDYGAEEGGLLYYAMELLEGEDLAAAVRREGPLEFDRVHRILLQAASALAEAHSLGIVHRDVKPENLFLLRVAGDREIVKVLDFGIAVVTEGVGHRITHDEAITGTPSTMPPESVRGEPATPASDVYSLGCVAYFMLAGQMPFAGKRMAAVLQAHLHDLPLPPSVIAGDPIPMPLEALVMRCLEKEPTRRFRDAGALCDALAAIEPSELGSRPRMSTVSEPREERTSLIPVMTTLPGTRKRPTMETKPEE